MRGVAAELADGHVGEEPQGRGRCGEEREGSTRSAPSGSSRKRRKDRQQREGMGIGLGGAGKSVCGRRVGPSWRGCATLGRFS